MDNIILHCKLGLSGIYLIGLGFLGLCHNPEAVDVQLEESEPGEEGRELGKNGAGSSYYSLCFFTGSFGKRKLEVVLKGWK